MKRYLVVMVLVFIAGVVHAGSISKFRNEDVTYAPRPEYPYKARLHFLQGSGSFILRSVFLRAATRHGRHSACVLLRRG